MIDVAADLSGEPDLFDMVAAKIKPIATAMCQAEHPNKDARYCDFRIVRSGSSMGAKNATQSIDADGRPLISVSRALIAGVRNADELGLVMGHEAGHQIGNHLERLNGAVGELALSSSGSSKMSGLRQVNVKALELEADAIGVVIAYRAGFDPLRGAAAIPRFTPKAFRNSDTHPEVSERLRVIGATLRHLEAGGKVSL